MSRDLEKCLEIIFRLENINPQYMNNDHTHYQRFRIEKRILELIALLQHDDNSPNHLRIAAKRSDGTYWIINGQHHTEASVRLGVPLLQYKVFDSEGWEHEKKVFDAFQDWQTLTAKLIHSNVAENLEQYEIDLLNKLSTKEIE